MINSKFTLLMFQSSASAFEIANIKYSDYIKTKIAIKS